MTLGAYILSLLSCPSCARDTYVLPQAMSSEPCHVPPQHSAAQRPDMQTGGKQPKLVAFAEARDGGDSSASRIAVRTSTDGAHARTA